MLKLYSVPISLYCAKIRIVLRHKKLEWEEVLPTGGYGSKEYKNIVPAGNLPALVHHDLLLGDSEAIAEYLNEFFPKPEMLPGNASERAKLRERSRFHDTRLEPTLRALFAHIDNTKRDNEFVEKQWGVLGERLTQLETMLPSELDTLTLADCGIVVTCTWINQLSSHFGLPSLLNTQVKNHLQRLGKFDAVATELAEYQPRLTNWLASQ